MSTVWRITLLVAGLALALGSGLVTVGESAQADNSTSLLGEPGSMPTLICDNTNDGGVLQVTPAYVLIDVDCWHAGSCLCCGEIDYSGSPYGGDPGICWFSPCPFVDPVPQGNIVTGIKAEVRAVGCPEFGGSLLTKVYVNGTLVGSGIQQGNCACSTCFPLVMSSQVYRSGFPGYVYGGANQLGLNIDGASGVSDVYLTIYYSVSEVEHPKVSPSMPSNWTLSPAQISTQYLSVNPQQANAGQTVTVSTNVVNTGDQAGNYNVALKIDGRVEQARMVSVGPQATQPVKFTVSKSQPGTYTVAIDGQQDTFSVLGTGSTNTKAPVSAGLIAIILVGTLILVALVVLVITRRSPA